MLKQSFRDFIFSTNTDGSGKAALYVRALDMLGPILTKHYPQPIVGGSMWHSFSLADIQALHEWICTETKKGAASPVLADFESPSYWTKNFCSAAVKAYGEFMADNEAGNPENGLCLSATYDAAFDRHLISFDERYRLVVSKAIKDHYADAAAKSYFLDLEGQKMSLPAKFLPSQTLLEKHRALLAG